MATPALEQTTRELWPAKAGNCSDGHVGPFTLTSHVPRHYSCACGHVMGGKDRLAHSVFMDPTIDPYDICGGGSGFVNEYVANYVQPTEGNGYLIAALICVAVGAFLSYVWFVS